MLATPSTHRAHLFLHIFKDSVFFSLHPRSQALLFIQGIPNLLLSPCKLSAFIPMLSLEFHAHTRHLLPMLIRPPMNLSPHAFTPSMLTNSQGKHAHEISRKLSSFIYYRSSRPYTKTTNLNTYPFSLFLHIGSLLTPFFSLKNLALILKLITFSSHL